MIICNRKQGHYSGRRICNERHTHHKQVIVVHYIKKGKLTITKSKSSRLSYNVVVSLPLESILSKISKYEAYEPNMKYLLPSGKSPVSLFVCLHNIFASGIYNLIIICHIKKWT